MLKIPEKSLFPGKGEGPGGNGMSEKVRSQAQWLATLKTHSCNSCHQLGNKPTRTIMKELGEFKSSYEAWLHRIQVGPMAETMVNNIGSLDTQVALKNFADWTDRIAAGELPKSKPQRPQGVERNVVVTLWDWGDAKTYLHDEIATDKRNPTVNAYGKIYSATEDSTDNLPILDPKTHTVTYLKSAPRDPNAPAGVFIQSGNFPSQPSPYWGSEKIWNSQTSVHNPMLDQDGRVWMTARIRRPQTPAFCQKGSDHPSAKLFPMTNAARQVSMLDPKTGKLVYLDTCFTTHHLIFAEDKNNTLWLSAGGARSPVVGWINTKMYLETGDEQKSQGWTALILDTNGNGKRDEDYVEPNQPVDPSKDKRIVAGLYGIGYDPNDGTIWGSVLSMPGGVVHVIPGDNPPATTLAEYYEVPFNEPKAAVNGYGPRGMDIDRKGVVWIPLASGHMASFDRKKCKGPLNGPTIANGRHCPEGWTLYQFPGPAVREHQGRAGRGAVELLHLGRSVRHPRARQGRADGDRQSVGRDRGAGGRQVRLAARALPDGFPCEGARWPHRRSQRRLEGQRPVVDLCGPRALSHRRRQGHDQQGCQVSAAARSAGAVGEHVLDAVHRSSIALAHNIDPTAIDWRQSISVIETIHHRAERQHPVGERHCVPKAWS